MKASTIFSFAVLAMLAAGACAMSSAQTPPAQEANPLLAESNADLASDGRRLVVRECASCHAIDQNTVSPRAGAPPMKTILDRYDPEMLAENLIEGIRIGHDDMPLFDFNVIGADSLIAYLKSIAQEDAHQPSTGRGS